MMNDDYKTWLGNIAPILLKTTKQLWAQFLLPLFISTVISIQILEKFMDLDRLMTSFLSHTDILLDLK